MKSFLKKVLGVEQFHTMESKKFDDIEKSTELFKESMENKKQPGGSACVQGPSGVENEIIVNIEDEFDLHQALRNRMIMKIINIEERNEENVEAEEGLVELM